VSALLVGCGGSSGTTPPVNDDPDPQAPVIETPIETPDDDPDPEMPIDETPNDNPANGAFDQANRAQFIDALSNAWIGSECESTDSSEDGFASYKIVKTFTDSEYIYNELVYPSGDCTGSPFADWYPSIVESWSLGEFITLADGTGAWEFDSRVTQPGAFAGDPGPAIDTPNFDFATIREGKLYFGDSFAELPENRPTVIEATYFEPRQAGGDTAIDAALLQGTWFSGCVGGVESAYIFNPDTVIIENENWAEAGCEGESFQIRKSTFDVTYGDRFVTRDGDTMLAYDITALSNETIKFDASQGLEPRNFQVPIDMTEYRAVSVDTGNTLIPGYCLYVDTENDDCQNSADRRPDMVDYNWIFRFIKQ